jgi:quercetin dioxygenase-like cupin family protein
VTDTGRGKPEQLMPGVWRTLVDGEEATLIIYQFSGQSRAPAHEHSWEHLGYVAAGEITIGLPDRTFTVGAGGTYHIPSNVPHTGDAGPRGATLVEARRRGR